MNIGILGGTFDPPHFGHLNLAINMVESHRLDEVWFVPANSSPLKKRRPASAHHRLAMLKRAIKGIKPFSIYDGELKRKGPSYTIDTLRTLKELYPKNSFYLIVGSDLLPSFHLWKDFKKILELAPPLVGSREGSTSHLLKITPMPLMDISSQDVGKRLKKGAFCGHLVPHKVLDYIAQNDLYS